MAIAVNKEGERIESGTQAALEPSVQIPKVSPRLKTEVLVALFGVLNVIFARQIITLEIFSPVRADLRSFWSGILVLLGVALLLYCGGSIFSQAFRDIKKRFISRNVCTALALIILASYAISIAGSNFRLLATQPLFDSLMIVLFIVAIDKLLYESFLVSVANKVGLRFGDLFSKKVREKDEILDSEATPLLKDLNPKEIEVGSTLRVSGGDIIPCDMEIKSGSCEVRERKFSTRFQLRYKTAGNNLFAGSRIVRGEAEVEVSSLPEESVLAYFIAVLNQRVSEETETASVHRKKYEAAYCLGLLFVAACTALYWTDQEVGNDQIIRYVASVLLISLVPRWLEIRKYLRGLAISSGFSKGLLVRSTKALRNLVKIKSLAIDYSVDLPPGESRLTEFELIDNRLDKASLATALATLYAATEDASLQTISEDFRQFADSDNFLEISAVQHFPGRGLYATVEGVDLTVGTEEFLLERGVVLQPSEVGEPRGGQELFYVAIGADAEARVYISRPFLGDGLELSNNLRKLGVKPLLLSTGDKEVVDKAATAAGIELPYAFGGLEDKEVLSKLEMASPVALLASEATPDQFVKRSNVSLAVFDEIRWDVDRTDFIAFNRNIGFVADAWNLAKAYVRTIQLNALLAVALTGLLVFLAATGLMAPVVTAISCAVASVFMYLSVYILFPKKRSSS